MNQDDSKKPFLPRDKAISWTITIICGLVAVLIAGPLAISGIVFEVSVLVTAGKLLFWSCWFVGVAMGAVFLSGLLTGRYKDIGDRDWQDQLW